MTRFNEKANTVSDAANYFRNRAFQLLADGYYWFGRCTPLTWQGITWGVMTQFHDDEKSPYYSIYVLEEHRKQGHLTRYLKHMRKNNVVFITLDSCNVFEFLEKHVNVKLVGDHLNWPEYKKIEEFYGDHKAKRSKLFWMNHIDEGVALLRKIGANERTQKAFMLHPLVQHDDDLKINYPSLNSFYDQTLESNVLILAMEYRNIANQFLSPMEQHSGYDNPESITLSPLLDVNQMLVADKVQNRKDFIAYHLGTHPRSDWLDLYFRQWLKRLKVNDEDYQGLSTFIDVPEAYLEKSIEG